MPIENSTLNSTLDADRRMVADTQFSNYDFGDLAEVEDASGWEYTSPGTTWGRAVFLQTDEGDDAGSTQNVNFVVRFKENTSECETAYAITNKGVVFGSAMKDEKVETINHNEAIQNISEVLMGVDGEYLAQIYNQICSDQVTYQGDSIYIKIAASDSSQDHDSPKG